LNIKTKEIVIKGYHELQVKIHHEADLEIHFFSKNREVIN